MAVAGEAVAVVGKAEVEVGKAVEANGIGLGFVAAVALAFQQGALGWAVSYEMRGISTLEASRKLAWWSKRIAMSSRVCLLYTSPSPRD